MTNLAPAGLFRGTGINTIASLPKVEKGEREIATGQGIPAPPHPQAWSPSHGLSGWFSQTQEVSRHLSQIMITLNFRGLGSRCKEIGFSDVAVLILLLGASPNNFQPTIG